MFPVTSFLAIAGVIVGDVLARSRLKMAGNLRLRWCERNLHQGFDLDGRIPMTNQSIQNRISMKVLNDSVSHILWPNQSLSGSNGPRSSRWRCIRRPILPSLRSDMGSPHSARILSNCQQRFRSNSRPIGTRAPTTVMLDPLPW
jgi:hypothetical protein